MRNPVTKIQLGRHHGLRRGAEYARTGTAGKVLLFALVVISLYGLYYLFNRALQRALRRPAALAE
jgi:hypothetical protein